MVKQVIPNDVRITGNLEVAGSLPTVQRTALEQDNRAVYSLNLADFRVHDAFQNALPGTAASDDLALVGGTLGTAHPMVKTSDLASAGATTQYARILCQLPPEYVDGESVEFRIHAAMATVADTAATVDIECYGIDKDGTVTSDICATAAQSINSATFTDYDFTITATSLVKGDMLDVRMAIAVNDAATGSGVIAEVGAFQMLLDIKG